MNRRNPFAWSAAVTALAVTLAACGGGAHRGCQLRGTGATAHHRQLDRRSASDQPRERSRELCSHVRQASGGTTSRLRSSMTYPVGCVLPPRSFLQRAPK
jgi:hypothetical protein